MKNRFFAIAMTVLLLPAAAFSGPEVKLPPGVIKGASVEGIDEYMLPNGLKILLFPDHSKPTATVNVTYKVGSRHENYGETGMAHLLEHLLFKGTPRHPNIPQELTAHGTSPNASTSYDRTNYFETFAATDENLDWALGLEADRMINSNIAKKDLDSEMTVVRNEFESGENEPQRILMERVMSTAYLWHNYGKSIIGARSDIENVPIDRLQAFYHNWYQPDNAVLTVAGDFDQAKTLNLIKKKFGGIRRPKRVMQKTYTQDPTQDGERQVILRRVGDTQAVMAAYHVPASSVKDSVALDMLAYVIGDTPSGRLYKALVETKKAAAAYAFNYDLREAGLLMFGAIVRKEGSLEEVRDTLLNIVEGSSTVKIDKESLERARTDYLKNFEITLKSPDRVGMQLSESIAAGDWRLFFLRRDLLKEVTVEDVERAAKAYLKPSNRTLGLFYPTEKPDRAEIPAPPDVASLVKDYKGGKALSAGEAFDSSPENIDKRTSRATLKDGLRLAMLPKKTRGSSVRLVLSLKTGSEESLKNMAAVSDLTGSMIMRGTLHHTRQQIEDEFNRLKTRARISGGGISLETDRENLPAALRLAAEVLKEPSFPESEFATLKQEELAGIEEQKSDPQALATQKFYRHLAPYPQDDIRYSPTFDEQIARVKAVTLEQVKAFHKEFYGASAGQLAVVGDFDPKEIKALSEELFGGWVSPKPFSRLVYKSVDIPAENIFIETPDKANANAYLGVNFAMRDDNPDYPALALADFMIGGGFLNSRLAVRIRQKEGLSYGVGSWMSVNSLDEHARFGSYAIFNPKNADKLEKAFREELARVATDGFTKEELDQARDGWLQSHKMARANDARLVSKLASNEYLGRSMAWDGDLEKKVAGLTPELVRDAFKRHVALDKISFVMAGDFAKAKAEAAAPAK
ncbi:MAG: insulinase family protein [Elusimicrobia bacterium CG_4_10_14_0_2_um_filter_56_8]|nr:MAG: pseudouridine synthase [Elusimicrobia bacterium CG1_02_56_21]PJA14816.1 MAG: insulinase family protein [Elusimicrobia bacterium CG_4_10_14_0_2_um_filter_56_8]